MLYLLALVLYVKGRLSSGHRRGLFWIGAGLSYLLGLFTKENVAILPLFAALYEFYFFQNVDLGPRGRKALCYSVGLILFIGLVMGLVWGRRYIDVITEGYQMRDFTMGERVLTQFRAVLYYVTLLVYPAPSRLNLDYDFPTSHGILDPPSTLLSILIVCGLIGYSFWSARKNPLFSYFVLWYFGNLVIESSIFPLEMVYEHRLYLPAIGPFVLFSVLVAKGWEKIRTRMTDTVRRDYPLWGLFLVLTVLLIWGTHERNKVWRDPITLWQDCLKKSPRKERPHYNLGFQYSLVGRYQEAIEAFKESIRLRPNDPESYNNLGLVHKAMGAYPQAIETYQEAIRIRPGFARALNNLGVAYSETGLHREAIEALARANDLKPNDTEIKNNLGVAYRRAGKYQEAVRTYMQALRHSPDDPEICSNLGDTHYHLGNFHEAIEAFRQAIRLKPGIGLFYYNLGVACTALSDHEAAAGAYRQALEIDPGHVQARFNLALSYLSLNKRDLALGQYQILKEIDRDQAGRLLALIKEN
jgi:tetratricopeptide (TPR) repeat protein